MMKDVMKFILIVCMLVITFCAGRHAGIAEMYSQVHDMDIDLRVCQATFELFEEDMDTFCADRFEKMNCGL